MDSRVGVELEECNRHFCFFSSGGKGSRREEQFFVFLKFLNVSFVFALNITGNALTRLLTDPKAHF